MGSLPAVQRTVRKVQRAASLPMVHGKVPECIHFVDLTISSSRVSTTPILGGTLHGVTCHGAGYSMWNGNKADQRSPQAKWEIPAQLAPDMHTNGSPLPLRWDEYFAKSVKVPIPRMAPLRHFAMVSSTSNDQCGDRIASSASGSGPRLRWQCGGVTLCAVSY